MYQRSFLGRFPRRVVQLVVNDVPSSVPLLAVGWSKTYDGQCMTHSLDISFKLSASQESRDPAACHQSPVTCPTARKSRPIACRLSCAAPQQITQCRPQFPACQQSFVGV